ncbi:MAG: M56 family metallopeptidase [Ginsengibacter sp.]
MIHLIAIKSILDKLIPAISWTLIHSLWQGLLLALITAVLLVLTRKSKAAYRYNIALLLCLVFCAMCAFTFTREMISASSERLVYLPGIKANVAAMFPGNVEQWINTFTGYLSTHTSLIVFVWFVFFLFRCMRILAALAYNQRIMKRQVYEVGEMWTDVISKLCEKLAIRKAIKLFQSGYIKIPVVVGHLKPVILMPVTLLAGLPAEQLEAILLHELAHIRRSDYIINFLQNIIESIFFFNPGLLWMSSFLKEERENCCDDIALEKTGSKKNLIQALVSFKEHELYAHQYATAFAGRKNYLLRRVNRIAGTGHKKFGIGEKLFFMVSIIILCGTIATGTLAQIEVHAHNFSRPVNDTGVKPILPNDDKTNKTVVKKVKAIIKGIEKKEKIIAGTPAINERLIKEKREQEEAVYAEIQSSVETARMGNEEIAFTDQQISMRDEMQARLDQVQAGKDQQQAMLSQKQAAADRRQAIKSEAQAKLSEVQSKRDEEHALREIAEADAARSTLKN